MTLKNFFLNQLKDQVLSGKTRHKKWRVEQLQALSNLLDNHQLIHLVDYNNEDEGFKIGSSLSYGSQTSEILVKLRSV